MLPGKNSFLIMRWWIKIQLACFQAVLETLPWSAVTHQYFQPVCFLPWAGTKLKMAERRAMRGASIMEQKVSLWSPSGADDVDALLKEQKQIVESRGISNFSSSMDKDVAAWVLGKMPLSSVLWLSSLSSDCPLLGCGSASELSQMSLFAHVVNHYYK